MGRVMFASVWIRVSDTFCNEEGKVKLPLGRD